MVSGTGEALADERCEEEGEGYDRRRPAWKFGWSGCSSGGEMDRSERPESSEAVELVGEEGGAELSGELDLKLLKSMVR
jgi:hypothetical protein